MSKDSDWEQLLAMARGSGETEAPPAEVPPEEQTVIDKLITGIREGIDSDGERGFSLHEACADESCSSLSSVGLEYFVREHNLLGMAATMSVSSIKRIIGRKKTERSS